MRFLQTGFALATLAALSGAEPRLADPPTRIVRRWAVEEGLPNGAIVQALKTREGYLLLPSWAGMFRFDGVQFQPVAMDLPNIHTLAVLEARDGALWIASNSDTVARWTPQGFRHVQLSTVHPNDALKTLAEDDAGRVWVGGPGGLDVIDGERATNVVTNTAVTALVKGRAGIWAAVGGQLCRSRGEAIDCAATGHITQDANLLLEDRRGTLWIAEQRGGLRAWDGKRSRRFTACVSGAACLDGSAITRLADGADGVWVGYANGAVDLVFGEKTRSFLPAAQRQVQALFEDQDGLLWVFSDALYKLQKSRVRMVERTDGGGYFSSIVQDGQGRIWTGGQCGPGVAAPAPAATFDGAAFRPRFQNVTGKYCTSSLLATRDGSLWIGTLGGGVFRILNGHVLNIGKREGLDSPRVPVLFEARDGAVWLATSGSELYRFADGRLSPAIKRADGRALGFVVSIAEDQAGGIWVGSNDHGLSVYRNGELRAAPPPVDGPNLPSSNISALLFDKRGDLWIGTAARGLFRLRHGRYEAFGPSEGLPDRLIALIVEDRDENIWVGTAKGIIRLARANIEEVARGQASLEPILLDRKDGLLDPESTGGGFDPSGLRAHDGSLWFSTIDGAAMVSDETFHLNKKPLTVSIERARVDSHAEEARPEGVLEIPAAATNVEIDYTAPTFLRPERVRFAYRLIGLDEHWFDAGARRTAYFSRPHPGRYKFEVRVANEDWTWGEPSTLDVVFLPFWWERRSVQAGGLLLLVLFSSAVVFKVDSWRHRARVAALEREQAVHRERERLARDLHDDLGSRLAYISLLSDRAEAGQAAPIAAAAREAAQAIDELVFVVDARNDTVEAFANYVAHLTEEIVRGGGIDCRVRIAPMEKDLVLEAGLRRNLYLAVKEAVTNALKHAKATEIHLQMEVRDDSFRIVITDNGVGLPEDGGDPTGNGLANLKKRLEDMGGTAEYNSRLNEGLRVTLTVPLPSPPETPGHMRMHWTSRFRRTKLGS